MIVGHSPAIRKIQQQIALAREASANVLILGEQGTGKELVARSLPGRELVDHVNLLSPAEQLLLLGRVELESGTRFVATATGKFLPDLFQLLSVFVIQIPPLRDRPGDIPLLTAHFLERATEEFHKAPVTIGRRDVQRLARYPWPGNVRELKNVIERGVMLSASGEFRLELDVPAPPSPSRVDQLLTDAEMRRLERDNTAAALLLAEGRIYGPGGAAEILGLRPTTLVSRLKKLRLTGAPSPAGAALEDHLL